MKINRINSCSTEEYEKKLDMFNEMKAQHTSELLNIRKEINKAIASNDFVKVQDLLKEQTEIIKRQNEEMLSIM